MMDRISTLPDAVLCYILSFMSTKEAVATSVLSKRWRPLWRSVPTLDFEDYIYNEFDGVMPDDEAHFVQSVHTFISSRDLQQPIQSFRLRCLFYVCDLTDLNEWINAAAQCRVEHFDLSLPSSDYLEDLMDLPSSILSCRTLVVLKLRGLTVTTLLRVDFPSLKILHLFEIVFAKYNYLAEFLSGCPALEEFKETDLEFLDSLNVGEFKCLPKLVRAYIHRLHVPLESVRNVEFLSIKGMCEVEDMDPSFKDLIPMFHNLTHITLIYYYSITDWVEVLQVLKRCPKLQSLTIDQDEKEEGGGDWPYPQFVPESISLHLKTCCIINYEGSKGEFRFARYILENAGFIQSMTFYIPRNEQRRLKITKDLSLCTRRSATCKLLFEKEQRRYP